MFSKKLRDKIFSYHMQSLESGEIKKNMFIKALMNSISSPTEIIKILKAFIPNGLGVTLKDNTIEITSPGLKLGSSECPLRIILVKCFGNKNIITSTKDESRSIIEIIHLQS